MQMTMGSQERSVKMLDRPLQIRPTITLRKRRLPALRLFLALSVVGLLLLAAYGPSSGRPASGAASSHPTVFVSARGSDSAPCTRARPCASFERAYRAAKPGQIVAVMGGTYGYQEVNLDRSK